MNEDLILFLKRNGISEFEKFAASMNYKIDVFEEEIPNEHMAYACYAESAEEVVPLSQIVGCSRENLKFDTSILNNFDNFFDSKSGDMYHKRSLSLLNISVESIVNDLGNSFKKDPIKTISIDGNYYISGNGLHRFMTLKLYYMLELYNGKTKDELDEKYKIIVSNKQIDVFRTYAALIGSLFNPPIQMTPNLTNHDWLETVMERFGKFKDSPQDYEIFISNIIFKFFKNGNSGDKVIEFMKTYFPTMFNDIIERLSVAEQYESLATIVSFIEKKYPEEKNELSIIIENKLPKVNTSDETKIEYKYFDLTQGYNDYGKRKDISKNNQAQMATDLNCFSEGSESLAECLKVLWSLGLQTISCCKGDHLSINYYNKPEINSEAYIAFAPEMDWHSYLSKEILENKDVIITESAIYYYGPNKEAFFKTLTRSFMLGKKSNQSILLSKLQEQASSEMEFNAFLYSLKRIGFSEEQIQELTKSYLEISKLSDAFYASKNADKEEAELLLTNWREARERFESDLQFYINRNNESIRSGLKI